MATSLEKENQDKQQAHEALQRQLDDASKTIQDLTQTLEQQEQSDDGGMAKMAQFQAERIVELEKEKAAREQAEQHAGRFREDGGGPKNCKFWGKAHSLEVLV